MKKAVNAILLIGMLLSLILALKISFLPVLEILPNRVKTFFVTTAESHNKFSLLYDLSVGFVISSIFYFIVEELPEKVKLIKAKKLICSQVNQLVLGMEQIISLITSKYGCPYEFELITQKDFLHLDGDCDTPNQEISYTTAVYDNNKNRKTGTRSFGTLNTIIKNDIEGIVTSIALIKKYEYFYAENFGLVECIRNIENCSMIQYYRKNKQECFLLQGTSKAILEFIKLYRQLKKLNFNTEYTITTLETEEDTKKYREDRESGKLLQNVIANQQKRHALSISNLSVVIFGKKYSTTILVKQMQRNFEAYYIPIDQIDIEHVRNAKYVVLVVDTESINKIKYLCQHIDNPINVILLSEQLLINKSKADIVKFKNITLVDEIYFKSIFRFKNTPIIINKNEPSEESINKIAEKIQNIVFEKK